jgi:hypothetical protein
MKQGKAVSAPAMSRTTCIIMTIKNKVSKTYGIRTQGDRVWNSCHLNRYHPLIFMRALRKVIFYPILEELHRVVVMK